MPHMTKTFLTAFTVLAVSVAATPAEAKHDKHYKDDYCSKNHHHGHSHGKHHGHKGKSHKKHSSHKNGHHEHKQSHRNYGYKESYHYSMHVPKRVKYSHHKSPLLIVITDDYNHNHYKHHYSRRAEHEGFVVAYAKRKHHRSHDKDIITALIESIVYDHPIDVRNIYVRHH